LGPYGKPSILLAISILAKMVEKFKDFRVQASHGKESLEFWFLGEEQERLLFVG